MKVAFLGLGDIGALMAMHLAWPLTVLLASSILAGLIITRARVDATSAPPSTPPESRRRRQEQ